MTLRILDALTLATSGRWPESVARKGGPNGSPSFATGASAPLAAPTLGTSALGAPWASVGALVALVGGALRADTHQASLERCRRGRRGRRGPVPSASLPERGTLRRAARRPLMVGVSSNTNALRGASMMPGRRRASSGTSPRSRTSKPTSSANHGVPLAAYMRPTPVWYARLGTTSEEPRCLGGVVTGDDGARSGGGMRV